MVRLFWAVEGLVSQLSFSLVVVVVVVEEEEEEEIPLSVWQRGRNPIDPTV
jgi:hypothetical protein